jgi:hypothetical protein
MPRSHGRARSGLARLTRAALVSSLVVVAVLAFAGTAAAAPTTYYLDCSAGNDGSAGKATGSGAWRTLSRANSATLVPGDKLLLRNGCTWTGPLIAKWKGTAAAPITIANYGTGALPMIQNAHDIVQITGSYLVVQNITTRADAPGYDSSCGGAPMGWRVGFRLFPGSSYNTVKNVTATGLYNGIFVEAGSHHNKITGNHMIRNNLKDVPPQAGGGAVGILLMGDDNDVSWNDISGSDACSVQYGRDGSAIEIYRGRRNSVHHNTAVDNHYFMELGNKASADTTVAYNKVYSSLKTAGFLMTRGAGDTSWGPVYGTKAYNNTVYLTGANSYAVQCIKGCNASVLSLRNNIIVSQWYVGYADAAFDEGNNLYWQQQGNPKVWFPISSTSRKLDPRLVNPAALDFRLNTGSPAIDWGSMVAYNLGFRQDLANVAVPRGAAPDIGAYER